MMQNLRGVHIAVILYTACFVYLQIQERILSPFSRLVIKVSCCDQISILHQGRLKKNCAIKKENNSS